MVSDMDVLINSRDIALDSCGNPIYIQGIDEILQRVRIACTVTKGSFSLDRELGRHTLYIDRDDPMLTDRLEMIFLEATVDIPYTTLFVDNLRFEPEHIVATVYVECGDDSGSVEVFIDG